MKLYLVLLIMELMASRGHVKGLETSDECCNQKTLSGASYTLVESGSSEVGAYGCDTAGNCVYKSEQTGERFCFKRGGKETPTCETKSPCDGLDVLVTRTGYSSDSYTAVASSEMSCTLPTFPEARAATDKYNKFVGIYQCNNRVYVQGPNPSNNKYDLLVLENKDTWTNVEFPEVFERETDSELHMAPGDDNKLYIRETTKSNIWAFDCVKHANAENSKGAAWQKLDFTVEGKNANDMDGSMCVSGDKLAIIDDKNYSYKVRIYDLTKTSSSSLLATIRLNGFSIEPTWHSITCKDGKAYLIAKKNIDDTRKIIVINMENDSNPPKIENFIELPSSHAKGEYISIALVNDMVTLPGGNLFVTSSEFRDAETLLVLADNGTWVEGAPYNANEANEFYFQGVLTLPISYL